jgi:hypothetical protein
MSVLLSQAEMSTAVQNGSQTLARSETTPGLCVGTSPAIRAQHRTRPPCTRTPTARASRSCTSRPRQRLLATSAFVPAPISPAQWSFPGASNQQRLRPGTSPKRVLGVGLRILPSRLVAFRPCPVPCLPSPAASPMETLQIWGWLADRATGTRGCRFRGAAQYPRSRLGIHSRSGDPQSG